jgi:hypothetical protein
VFLSDKLPRLAVKEDACPGNAIGDMRDQFFRSE